MAKRKKSKRKSTAKRSGKRVRGASNGMDALLMVVGTIGGSIGTAIANSKVAFLQNKWVHTIETLIGGVIAWKLSHPFVRGLGLGMAATGGTSALKGFGVLTGVGIRRQFPQTNPVNGFRNVPKIGNPNIPGKQFPSPGSVGRSRDMTYAGVYTN